MYVPVAELGSGAHSRVICISHEKQFVAVKIVTTDEDDMQLPKRRKEEDILKIIHNPNICELYDVRRDGFHVYLHLEPLLAGPLHQHIKHSPSGRLPLQTVRTYTAEILSALVYLSSIGCIHRDIKASNCVLHASGHLKLCDFDKAKLVCSFEEAKAKSSTAHEDVLMTYTVVGTAHSMAPEVVAKSGHSFKSDWWGLGVLVYEMLTGSPPNNVGLRAGAAIAIAVAITTEVQQEALQAIQSDSELANGRRPGSTGVQPCSRPDEWWWVDSSRLKALYDECSSLGAESLINGLLRPDPDSRWGPADFQSSVQNQDFLSGIDWEAAASGTNPPAPFNRDLGFLNILNVEGAVDDDGAEALSAEEQLLFEGF